MSKKKVEHVHKYLLIKVGSYTKPERWEVYKCMLPGCNHYIPKPLALGRQCICWACGETFQIKKHRMLRKPTCGCRGKFKPVEFESTPLIDLLRG